MQSQCAWVCLHLLSQSLESQRHLVTIDNGNLLSLNAMAAGGEAWLTFMGNEFGHPEWIVRIPALALCCLAPAIAHALVA